MYSKHHTRSHLHFALGTQYGCCRSRTCDLYLQLCRMPVLFYPSACKEGKNLCMYLSLDVHIKQEDCQRRLRCWHSGRNTESSECYRNDRTQQFHFRLRHLCGCRHGHFPKARHDPHVYRHGNIPGRDAAYRLQLRKRQY